MVRRIEKHMSRQRRLRRRSDEESSDERTTAADAADLLGVLNDDYARELLEAVAGEAKTARDLVRECSASRATVYRRLNRLEETDLVETEMTFDADGHHRTAYRATDTDVTISLDRTGLTAELVDGDDDDRRDDPDGRRSWSHQQES